MNYGVLMLGGFILIANIPYYSYIVWEWLCDLKENSFKISLDIKVQASTSILFNLNHCINIVNYILFNARFRSQLKKIFKKPFVLINNFLINRGFLQVTQELNFQPVNYSLQPVNVHFAASNGQIYILDKSYNNIQTEDANNLSPSSITARQSLKISLTAGRSFPPTNVLHAYPGRLWQFVNKNGKSTNKDNIKSVYWKPTRYL